jgi:MOSC domain-containing protein YiiM
MKEVTATLVSVHAGNNEDYSKAARKVAEVDLEGFPGDKHRGFQRIAQSWDAEATGTPRRNERQWSGVSLEELETIRVRMDLKEPLLAATLGANVCIEGIPGFSQLPKGSKLVFPSGAVLLVEEDNPPCSWMAEQVALEHTTNSGKPVPGKLFPKYALGLRGVVGVVDVPGTLRPGDSVTVKVYEPSSG